MQYDRDRSGTVEPHEMHGAIQSWGMLILCVALIKFLFLCVSVVFHLLVFYVRGQGGVFVTLAKIYCLAV